MARDLEGVDVVIHLASTLRSRAPDATRAAASVRLARNVVEGALGAGVRRVVLLSSVRAAPVPPWWAGRGVVPDWPVDVVRAGRAIERVGARAARAGLDVVVLRLGGVHWPDWPPAGVEGDVWLSHEDCCELFRDCIEAPFVPGRCVEFVAVSDTPGRGHSIDNPLGWRPRTRSAGLRRFVRSRLVRFFSER
jgi:nucleoside-diphosphate-sugar epimerase